MTVDESEFFREATLHICGDLDIKKAMVQLLQYLQKFMPADRIILERYDTGLGSIRSIVEATPECGTRGDVLAPLSEETKTLMEQMYRQGVPEPYYENSPNEDPAARELLAFHKLEASAFLGLPLGTSDHEPGAVVLLTTSSFIHNTPIPIFCCCSLFSGLVYVLLQWLWEEGKMGGSLHSGCSFLPNYIGRAD